jgi:hypothetical protein
VGYGAGLDRDRLIAFGGLTDAGPCALLMPQLAPHRPSGLQPEHAGNLGLRVSRRLGRRCAPLPWSPMKDAGEEEGMDSTSAFTNTYPFVGSMAA